MIPLTRRSAANPGAWLPLLQISRANPVMYERIVIFVDDTDIMEYVHEYRRLRNIPPKERLRRSSDVRFLGLPYEVCELSDRP
jgi:hypothetical protein